MIRMIGEADNAPQMVISEAAFDDIRHRDRRGAFGSGVFYGIIAASVFWLCVSTLWR
jgi:hypothetical protein